MPLIVPSQLSYRPVTLPSFTVSASAEKSVNPFGKETFDAADGEADDILEQERKALEEFQVTGQFWLTLLACQKLQNTQ